MKVIFAGHAGINKAHVIDSLKREIIRNYYQIDPDSISAEKIAHNHNIGTYDLEKEIESYLGVKTLVPFLETDGEAQQRKIWIEGMKRVLEKIDSKRPEHCLLSIHLTFQRTSRFFSPLAWPGAIDCIKNFKPDLIVTLINDIYEVQRRIKKGSYFKLRELTTWRSVEILMADILANAIFPDHATSPLFPCQHSFVVAVKHPPSMLYRLLFETGVIRIYACIPISRTRDEAIKRREIEEVIKVLNKHFVVFNPLTIDEKPFENLINSAEKNGKVHMNLSDRWQMEESLLPMYYEEMYPIELDLKEILEITQHRLGEKSEIDRNIERRDFRLIDQSRCVLAYRPRYGNKDVSQGMRAEIIYAGSIRPIPAPVVYVHDPLIDGELDDPLGPEMSYRITKPEEAISLIKSELIT
jgi:hypothetical protein